MKWEVIPGGPSLIRCRDPNHLKQWKRSPVAFEEASCLVEKRSHLAGVGMWLLSGEGIDAVSLMKWESVLGGPDLISCWGQRALKWQKHSLVAFKEAKWKEITCQGLAGGFWVMRFLMFRYKKLKFFQQSLSLEERPTPPRRDIPLPALVISLISGFWALEEKTLLGICAWIPIEGNWEMTDVCCLKAFKSELVYYTAIHDEHIQNKHMDIKSSATTENTKIMASSPITSWRIDGEKWKQWQVLFSWAP